eukprot:CFRG7504T1
MSLQVTSRSSDVAVPVGGEDMIDLYPWLAILWATAFALTVALTIVAIVTITFVFISNPRHKQYLLFFGITMFGIILLYLDRVRTAFGWYWGPEYAIWCFYLFGQNLTVCGELVRGARLVVICYGHPSIIPCGWVPTGQVKTKYLSTSFMTLAVLLLNIPVLIIYVIIATTENVIADEMYGENALLWESVDFATFFALTCIALLTWAKHCRIMWRREHSSQSTETTTDRNKFCSAFDKHTDVGGVQHLDTCIINNLRVNTVKSEEGCLAIGTAKPENII